jgi:hypothetical protein
MFFLFPTAKPIKRFAPIFRARAAAAATAAASRAGKSQAIISPSAMLFAMGASAASGALANVAQGAGAARAPSLFLSCPKGAVKRGMNCCQIAAGHVRCYRNPKLDDDTAVADFLRRTLRLSPSARVAFIDDADLARNPRRPLSAFAPPGDAPDVCAVEGCSFAYVRAIAHSAQPRQPGSCLASLQRHYCAFSPWRNLSLNQRFRRILVLGLPYAKQRGIDPRALPCIAARETVTLEPLAISEVNCGGYSSDEGLGQIIWPTFHDYATALAFRSEVAIPGLPEPDDLVARFNSLGYSAERQIELMAFTLAEKKRGREYREAFVDYNGSATRETYGKLVNACYECLIKRVDPETLEVAGDPMRCLSAALGSGRDIRADEEGIHALCEAKGAPIEAFPAAPPPPEPSGP